MKKNLFFISIILSLFICPLYSISYDGQELKKHLIETFDTHTGFPVATINSIIQNDKGELLIGGDEEGVFLYDGRNFSRMDLGQYSRIQVSCLYSGKKNLWIGGFKTLLKKEGNVITAYNEHNGLDTHDVITTVCETLTGEVYAGSGIGKLYRVERDRVVPLKQFVAISTIIQDSRGNVWIAAGKEGLYYYRNSTFIRFPLPIPDTTVITLYEDRKGALWVGTNNGLFGFNKPLIDKKPFIHFDRNSGLANSGVNRILEDAHGHLVVATGYGLNRIVNYDSSDRKVELLIGDVPVYTIFIDRENSLWIGTFCEYLKRYRETSFLTIERLRTFPLYRSCLLIEPDKSIWIGSNQGRLFHLTGNRIIPYLSDHKIDEMGIRTMLRDSQGRLWLGTQLNGFYIFDNNRLVRQKRRADSSADGIRHIFEDSKQRIWISTIYGVYRYDKGVYSFFTTREGLCNNYVYQVYEDRDQNIWISTLKGLMKIKDGEFRKDRNRELFLKGISILHINEDKVETGVFWIGSEGNGLYRLKNGESVNITTKNGLGNDFIFKTFEDQRGDLWFSTLNGIFKAEKSVINDCLDGKIKRTEITSFNRGDGINTVKCIYHSGSSIVESPDGELYFPTNLGISIVDPENLKINTIPPLVNIEKVYFDGKEVADNNVEKYRGVRTVRFNFNALTFISRDKVRLRYRLYGHEHEWHEEPLENENFANYSDLPAGKYTFQIKACNSSSIWNDDVGEFSFTLSPLIYQTALFKTVMVVLVGGVIFFAFVGVRKYRYFKRLENKYKGSNLDKSDAEKHLKSLVMLMEDEKPFLEEDLTLNSLAEKLNIAPRHLSQIINEQLDRNYNDFINYYRVEEAKKCLQTFDKETDSILDLCYRVGFNSKTPFYRAFKKHTGKTPLQFLKEQE